VTDKNICNAKDFEFVPYSPSVGSDSGMLYLATLKSNPLIQYVIKSESPELACNEFMYHKIASALGLHTQEVKLFEGVRGSKYAAGIRFSSNARKFNYEESTDANFCDFFSFLALYVILNEEDSQEFYIDEHDRVFKLDNAAAFNFTPTIAPAIVLEGKMPKAMEANFKQMIKTSLNYVEYNKYNIMCSVLAEKHGQKAESAMLGLFEKFAGFDDTMLDEAYDSLDKIYPEWVSGYYSEFVVIRQAECKRFLKEKC